MPLPGPEAVQSFLRSVLDAALDAIVGMDHEGNVIEFSSAAEEIFGYSRQEVLGKSLAELIIPPAFRESHRRALSRFLETGDRSILGKRQQITAMRADGTNFPVELAVTLLETDGPPRFMAFIRDITEQQRREAALSASQARYQDLFDNAPDMFVSVDARSAKIVECNQTLTRSLGYTKEELLGRDIFDVYHPDSLDAAKQAFQAFVETGEVRGAQLQLRRKDGSKIDVTLNVSAVRDEQGRIVYSRSVWRDVSEQRRAEEDLVRHRIQLEELVKARTAELERSHEQLRRAERLASIGTLAAGIAHQINNPLGGILLATRFAQDSSDDPAALGVALGDIASDAKRCGDIVKSLLRFAREDVLDKSPADLNAIVRSAAGRLRDCDAEIALHLSDALQPLSLNEIAIGEVTVNLLQNAIDAGANHIVLQTDATRDFARLSVCDDGSGIDPRDLQRIFDPFFTKQLGKGTGLGLSIAHSLVAEHGGTIDLTSEPGSGTTVTVNLPINARGDGEGSHR